MVETAEELIIIPRKEYEKLKTSAFTAGPVVTEIKANNPVSESIVGAAPLARKKEFETTRYLKAKGVPDEGKIRFDGWIVPPTDGHEYDAGTRITLKIQITNTYPDTKTVIHTWHHCVAKGKRCEDWEYIGSSSFSMPAGETWDLFVENYVVPSAGYWANIRVVVESE